MEFPETCWTALAQATLRGGPAEREAMDRLCRDYWRPVRARIAARGAPAEKVEDLTQEFFLQLMTSGFFRRADAAKGRFRSFLMRSLDFFLSQDVERSTAQRRGGHLQRVEMEEEGLTAEADETVFDREWARTLVGHALKVVEEWCVQARGAQAWEALRHFLPGGDAPQSQAELAIVLGVSESGAKTEVHRLRQRFREAIRREVARTVSSPREVDEEVSHLQAVLAAGHVA